MIIDHTYIPRQVFATEYAPKVCSRCWYVSLSESTHTIVFQSGQKEDLLKETSESELVAGLKAVD